MAISDEDKERLLQAALESKTPTASVPGVSEISTPIDTNQKWVDGEKINASAISSDVIEDVDYDPFDGERGTRVATLITLMRIYDVQLALLNEADPKQTGRIVDIHKQGKIVASLPGLAL